MNFRQKHERLETLLQGAGLRPTRQRMALAGWLFDGCDKHVTAERVHEAAMCMHARVSLATIYNTLNLFTSAGLLRQVSIDGGQVYFDTNISDHYHIFDEGERSLTDIPASSVHISRLPELPQGKRLSRMDVVLRVSSSSA